MRTTKVRTSLCPGVGVGYTYDEIVDIFGGVGVITRLDYFYYYYFYYLFISLFVYFLSIIFIYFIFYFIFIFLEGGGSFLYIVGLFLKVKVQN